MRTPLFYSRLSLLETRPNVSRRRSQHRLIVLSTLTPLPNPLQRERATKVNLHGFTETNEVRYNNVNVSGGKSFYSDQSRASRGNAQRASWRGLGRGPGASSASAWWRHHA